MMLTKCEVINQREKFDDTNYDESLSHTTIYLATNRFAYLHLIKSNNGHNYLLNNCHQQ